MSIANRVFVEIAPHSLQLAVLAGRRLVACGDYSLYEKDALAAFLAAHEIKQVAVALVSPKQPFARLSGQEAVSVRSEEGLLACAQTLCANPAVPVSAVACDAATGKPVDPAGQEPWLMAGATTESLTAVRDQLAALGLPAPALTALALPAQLGSVVAALQDMPESARVAVLALGENDSVLGLVSAAGVEAVRPVAVGFAQIYEAVQLGLGLKFRAAAPKLFFNAAYDFADASEKIAAHLAVAVQAALSEFSERPGILHVVGLPEKQDWLARALGQALGMNGWAPDAAKICSQLEMEVAAGIMPTANTLRLIQLGATNDATQAVWLPYALGDRPKPAPAPVVPPPAAPSPQKSVVAPPPAKAAVPVKSAAPAQPQPKVAVPLKAKVAPPPVAQPKQAAAPAPVAAPKTPIPVPSAAPATIPPTIPPTPPAPAEEASAPVAPETAAPGKSKRGLYIAAGALVVAGIVAAVVVSSRGGKSPSSAAPAKPAAQTAAVATVAARPSFSNSRYSFEISPQGVIQKLADSSGHVLLSAAGLDKLQGSSMSDGQRINFNDDGMDNLAHRATVEKAVKPDGTTFNIRITHKWLEVDETVVCLPDRLKVSVRFIPLNLREGRGVINAVHGLRFSSDMLTPDRPVNWSDHEAVYTTESGPVAVSFDDTLWAHYGTNGRQRVMSTGSTLDFEYTALYSDDLSLVLNYEIRMP